MTTLRDYQKYAGIWLDKFTQQMIVYDKRHVKKIEDNRIEIPAKHCIDISTQFKNLDALSAEYIVTLETLAVELIRELYKERGLTATDKEIIDRLNKGGVSKFQRLVKI
jgi:hypothetical protein